MGRKEQINFKWTLNKKSINNNNKFWDKSFHQDKKNAVDLITAWVKLKKNWKSHKISSKSKKGG